jgi:hypothetical protein
MDRNRSGQLGNLAEQDCEKSERLSDSSVTGRLNSQLECLNREIRYTNEALANLNNHKDRLEKAIKIVKKNPELASIVDVLGVLR